MTATTHETFKTSLHEHEDDGAPFVSLYLENRLYLDDALTFSELRTLARFKAMRLRERETIMPGQRYFFQLYRDSSNAVSVWRMKEDIYHIATKYKMLLL